MNGMIYSFSGTGNDYILAEKLSKELELVHRRIHNKVILPDEGQNILGIVFPVYFGTIPAIVEDFLRHLQISENTYVFVVTTQGLYIAEAQRSSERILRNAGALKLSFYGVYQPGNYLALYSGFPKRLQKKYFRDADRKLQQIIHSLRSRTQEKARGNRLFGLLMPILRNRRDRVGVLDRKFHQKGCISCGLCGAICPTENIVYEAGLPVWQGHCEQCMACIQWCPVEAIQYGRLTKHRTRYHHPQVTSQEMRLR